MSYTEDAVRTKLSALNETQESIVNVAQWIMFYRRYAPRTAQIWLQRLRDAGASKRLNLIYLANEVVQQSKARKREDFLVAFSPIVAEATALAYKGATNEVQQKLRRVIEVWRQRSIFELPIQEAIEAQADELDKSRSSTKKPALGGLLFSSSPDNAPPEIAPLIPLQVALSKAELATTPALTTANTDFVTLVDGSQPIPSPPVHAQRLNGLLRALATASGAVAESIKARQALLAGLETLLEANRTALQTEETQHAELLEKRTTIETRKRDVEDAIMRGLSAEDLSTGPVAIENDENTAAGGAALNSSHTSTVFVESTTPPSDGVDRPEMEPLTPPPLEPLDNPGTDSTYPLQELQTSNDEPPETYPTFVPTLPNGNSLQAAHVRPPSSSNAPYATGASSLYSNAKRRRLDREDEFAGFGGGGDALEELDDEVVGLLR